MTNNAQIIAAFLKGKGLSDAAVAGILGNLQEESSLNPDAYNGNEGAIGIAQWEGGRRTALQAFARANGTSETDLNTQLNFLWHELNTSERSSLSAIQSASSASEAAAIWDEKYERSAGTTRNARVSYANQFASNGFQGITSGHFTADSSDRQLGVDSAGTTQEDLIGSNPDGLGAVLTKIPELAKILAEAQAQGWTLQKFQQQIENSEWFKTHGQTYRSLIALQYSDPTTFKQQYAQQMATAESQVQQLAASYGFTISSAAAQAQAKGIVYGSATLDSLRKNYVMQAKSLFPGLSTQLDQGQTVTDIAQPYVQTMSSLLEVDPSTLSSSTPLIKKALQGLPSQTAGTTTPSVVPLWQFENMVRQDPRWGYTDNAKQSAASMLVQLGQNFGFNG